MTSAPDPSAGRFGHATARLTIGSVEQHLPRPIDVEAQYNPKELVLEQPFAWTEHEGVDAKRAEEVLMEFGGVKAATLTVELLFDAVEEVRQGGATSVGERIAKLQELASVRDIHHPEEEFWRPHFCVVVWGQHGLPPFRCVITALNVKYLMFSKEGAALRASCTLTLKAADRVALAKKKRGDATRPR